MKFFFLTHITETQLYQLFIVVFLYYCLHVILHVRTNDPYYPHVDMSAKYDLTTWDTLLVPAELPFLKTSWKSYFSRGKKQRKKTPLKYNLNTIRVKTILWLFIPKVLKKATIRKEQEPDFEEKRFNVTIGEDEREFDKENDFFRERSYRIIREYVLLLLKNTFSFS